jgi:hypothetical protein
VQAASSIGSTTVVSLFIVFSLTLGGRIPATGFCLSR